MNEIRNKYLIWDRNSEKSTKIYLLFGILSVLLSILIYPKINNLYADGLDSMESLFTDLGMVGSFLRILRVIVYVSAVYFIFDMIMNKASRFNVMKISMLISALSYAGVFYIISPIIKLLSFNKSNVFEESFGDITTLGVQLSKIKLDLFLSLLVFVFVFNALGIYIYFRNKTSKTLLVFKMESFEVDSGDVEAIELKNINLSSVVNKKVISPIIVILVLIIGFKVWDTNFNLKTIEIETMYDVHFTGLEGEGFAEVIKTQTAEEIFNIDLEQLDGRKFDLMLKQTDMIDGLDYKLNKYSELKNGDKVVLTIQNNKKELKNLGLKLSTDTLEFTVSDLSRIPNSAEEIKNIDDVINLAKDNIDFSSYLPDRNGKSTLDGVYFTNKQTYEKETGSIAGNSNQQASIGLIFKITGEMKNYFSTKYTKVEQLYFYRLDDLLIDEEGNADITSIDFSYIRHINRFNVEDMDRKIEDIMKTEYGMVKVK